MTIMDKTDEKVKAEEATAAAESAKPQAAEPTKLYTAKEIVAYLAEKFPECFKTTDAEIRPLKLGILDDIVNALKDDHKYSKTAIRHGIQLYTKSWVYLERCKENAARVDLDGNDAGIVSAEHAEYAVKKLEESKKIFAEKRAQAANAKKEAAKANGGASSNNHDSKKKPFNRGPRNFKNNRNGQGQERRSFNGRRPNGAPRPRREYHSEGFVNPSLDSLNVNDRVFVQIGYDPKAKKISGRIKKIEREDVYVDLVSGMSLKLSVDNLFIYDESRVKSENKTVTDTEKTAE